MKKNLAVLLCAVMLLALAACAAPAAEPDVVSEATEEPELISGATEEAESASAAEQRTIAILFTNDVHCGADENIGYAGLAAYKKHLEEKIPYVALVDCGDIVQGGYLGTISQGEMPIECVNAVGYDFCALGNHEFDYGMEQLENLIALNRAEYLCCNVSYTGSGRSSVSAVKPYEIVSYGDTKIAYIGIATPDTIQSSTPAHFKEDGEYVYDFHGGNDGQDLYDIVQSYVDECRMQGADYVIALSHLGVDEAVAPWRSTDVAANTCGIDVFLDGHSHTEIPCAYAKNTEGEDVLICQTGTKLAHIGQVTITPDGYITVGFADYAEKDPETEATIAALTEEFGAKLQEVVATSSEELSITDDKGIRMVRSRETAIGNLCADAYRIMTGADIGYVNGGGIRASLPAGDITAQDVINVHPFGNNICTMELTGKEIIDMLEYFYMNVQEDYVKNGEAVGEFGSFGSFSGLKCVVHTGIESTVKTDENEMFLGLGKHRRVTDVQVLNADTGVYEPISWNKTYTLASHDYMLKNGGCGMEQFLAGHEVVLDSISTDYQNLLDYIKTLDGDLVQYAAVEGRVTIVK